MMKKLTALVDKCLAKDEKARNSDFQLYLDVCKEMRLPVDISVEEMLSKHNELGYPAFESVSRARRKHQQYGKYQANSKVFNARKERENDFRLEYGNIHP